MRIAIEGTELESVNFEEILDILRNLTGVFRFLIQLYSNVMLCIVYILNSQWLVYIHTHIYTVGAKIKFT